MSKHQAIILAAGFSTRMGMCKADLPWHEGHTLLSYQASNLLQAGIVPTIVLGSHNRHCYQNCPEGSQIVFNSDPSRGKISSILTGLHALSDDFETVAITAVDQPRSVVIYKSLLQAYQIDYPLIVVLSYRGRIGHPLLFSRAMLPYLLNLQEATFGLKAIIQKFHACIRFVEWHHPEILIDLNSLDTYNMAVNKSVIRNPLVQTPLKFGRGLVAKSIEHNT